MLSKLAFAALVIGASTSALAHPPSALEKAVALQDGSSVYVFKDGKMAMEDRLGRVVSMNEGAVMKTRDGQGIVMVGNETGRLDCFLRTQLGGGTQ